MSSPIGIDPAARAAEAAGIALLLLDKDGRILYANGAAEPLLAQSRRRLTGRQLSEFRPWGETAAEMAARVQETRRELIAHDIAVTGPAGTQRGAIDIVPEGEGSCVAIRLAPPGRIHPGGEGAAKAAAGFGRMLSHELKNPIAGARGAAQLIAQNASGETGELAQIILTELDRARRIAEHWSRAGDIAASAHAPVNLHALAREAIASARSSAPEGVVFEEGFDPSLPETLGDRDLLLQAVLNLLINAREAVARTGTGKVRLSTRYRRPDPGGVAPEARLELEVRDNGPGVPDQFGENVFNPFVTSKPAGEGLGLAFVSRVADIHHGGVEFDSRPGDTAFRLFLREA